MMKRLLSFLNPRNKDFENEIERMKKESQHIVDKFSQEQQKTRRVLKKYDGHITRDILRATGWDV